MQWTLWGIALTGFAASALLTFLLIPFLRRVKAGQHIREEGPESHYAKAGTPSMGGIAIIAAIAVAGVLGGIFAPGMLPALAGCLLFGLVGFIDDYLKVVKKQNLGLRAWQKFSMQGIVAVAFALYAAYGPAGGTDVVLPFAGTQVDFGVWYVPFIVFTILAMVNAINLTDGLDGLASGVTAIVALCFVFLGAAYGETAGSFFFAGILGACLGFLLFNRHPAKVFMGDTGSLALGGAVALAAIVMKLELFLPLAGIIYVLEALSVVLQVGYFKASGGKRLFRMAPLHHHFEKTGMAETKVVVLFWFVTFLFCAIVLVLA